MSSSRLNVAVLYGGKNTEHEISLISAKNIVNQIDQNKYQVHLIAINHLGQWFWQPNFKFNQNLPCQFTPDRLIKINMDMSTNPFMSGVGELPSIDIVFPVLHGINGEDGTIQGLLRCLNLPFVGCDVLSSALCMDKVAMKQMMQSANIATAPWRVVLSNEIENIHVESVIKELGLPIFIKPANAGSSVGISKVTRATQLIPKLFEASQFDTKILLETMVHGREIECPIIGNQIAEAALPAEIITHSDYEFYCYTAKYIAVEGATLNYPAELDEHQRLAIQETAIQAYKAMHCEGMARVDCFLTVDDKVYVNEINTIPGFTPISLFPKCWQSSGLNQMALMTRLIDLALAKHSNRQNLHFQKHA